MKTIYDTAVIGGGASGMIAAYAAAEDGAKVLLFEKNEKLGKKLYITGKGRCNITNNANIKEFFANITRNPKFLMSAFNKLSNGDLIGLIEKNGVKTKTERGERVFPISDKSSDVISVFNKLLKKTGVEVKLNQTVKSIKKENNVFEIQTENSKYFAKTAVISTGGLSYPATGSTGDGYGFAKQFGHKIIEAKPALAPLIDKSGLCAQMKGLTLNNVGFKLLVDNKIVYEGMGELLFTHFGLSGPLALTASCYLTDVHDLKNKRIVAEIDLKPALSKEKLKNRFLRDLDANHNKQLQTYLKELLPSKMIASFLEKTRLDGKLKLNGLTKEMRGLLIDALKSFDIDIAETAGFKEAIITAGGINTKEINPSTMESKKMPGLFFAGEVIDVSALTGGYNLQIAFSTGYTAGKSLLNRI